MSRIVVIGAGVGGLAVAARLAAAGHRVSVYERAPVVGGKLGRAQWHTAHGTFRFDTGPSLFTLPQVFAELFARTAPGAARSGAGRPGSRAPRPDPSPPRPDPSSPRPDPGATGPVRSASRPGHPRRVALEEPDPALVDELGLVRLDPVIRHVFADGTTLDSCTDPARFAERIGAAMGERAAADWRRLWRRAERVWSASWRDVLTRDIRSPLNLAGLGWRVGDLAAVAPGRTLRGLARAELRDPRLRMLLERYATYTGADPRRAPAALVSIPYAELTFGGWYLRGGLGTLADALLRRCRELGVAVHTGAAVTGIEVTGGRVHGVRIGTTRVPADLVVSNVDAQSLYRDLLPVPRSLTALGDRSLAGFVLLLGVRDGAAPAQTAAPRPAQTAPAAAAPAAAQQPPTAAAPGTAPWPPTEPGPTAHHRVHFPQPQRYAAEFDAVFGDPGRGVPARLAGDPTVFVTVSADPAAGPAGYGSWFVLVNAARHGRTLDTVDWERPGLALAYSDRILDVLAQRGSDVRDRLVLRQVRTPADLARETGAPGGAIYGTAGHRLLRPANRGPVRGLYLVGGSTHPGGGLPLVALSARIVADAIGPA